MKKEIGLMTRIGLRNILAATLVAITVFVGIRLNLYFHSEITKYFMSEQIKELDRRISKLEATLKPD